MGRRLDEIAQRALVYELKRAIDRGDIDEMRSLARSNPRSTFSAYVLKNIGPTRRSVLMHALARDGLPFQTEAARRVVGGEHGEREAPRVHPEEG
jgi:hypothetical protein